MEMKDNVVTYRSHRVGSVTAGLSMVDSDDVFCHGDGSGRGMLPLGGITDVEILLVQIK